MKRKKLFAFLIGILVFSTICSFTTADKIVFAESEQSSSGGWISSAARKVEEDGIRFTFDSAAVTDEADRLWSAETIVTEKPFAVGKPFTFYSKMHWAYGEGGYPRPSCYTFTFADSKEGAVTKNRQIQIFNTSFGMMEVKGTVSNLFEDRNHRTPPEYNKFQITVEEDFTEIVINDREVKTFRSIAGKSFSNGEVYLGIGMRFDGGETVSSYDFSLRPIDGLMLQGASEQTIVRGAAEKVSFSLDSRDPNVIPEVTNADGNKLTAGEDFTYSYSESLLVFQPSFCASLNEGEHTFRLSGSKGADVIVKITVLTDTVSVGEWEINTTSGSTVAVTEGLLIRKTNGFRLRRTELLGEFGAETTIPFYCRADAFGTEDEILFVLGNGGTQIKMCWRPLTGKLEISMRDADGKVTEDTKNYHYSRQTEEHRLRFYRGETGWRIGLDEFDGVPIFPDATFENATLTVEAKFEKPAEVKFASIFAAEPDAREPLNGWLTLQNSKGKEMPDGTVVYELNDSRFDRIEAGDKAFSRERIFSAQGFDVTKPIVLYTHMDWWSCGSGWWGLNLSNSPYDFRIADKTVMPEYDLLIQGPFLGSCIVNRVNPGERLSFWDLNNPMVAYTDRTQLNKFVIEIGEKSTRITVNDSEQGEFSFSRANFPSGKVWLSMGAYVTESARKVNFAVSAVNAPHAGTGVYQTFCADQPEDIRYSIRSHGYEIEVLFDGESLKEKEFSYDPETNTLTVFQDSLIARLKGKPAGTYELWVRTSGTQAMTPLYIRYEPEKISSEENWTEHDDGVKPAKGGCSSSSSAGMLVLLSGLAAYGVVIKFVF